ncbi:TetR family transcriptional regulator [Streptomyces sp. TRM66268-LWL]|uniref:TetR family transcriptional regulator n=1 Tax=Streptomyces polyasparticus TaxID=2767826 RepID=A0ABR7SQB3_9ACTN|nr:TetR family transcriptional regulator [Streptomyces polyasparticus]MBC9717680.1 TetR family transcriptional regulator [Streptomyces polyasparticus]
MAARSKTSASPAAPAAPAAEPSVPDLLIEGQPELGLRERKKLKTRIAIRRATYRLIKEQGYDATTIEQIAAAAEVSPSTVFRYFATKEDIVLSDEYDPVMVSVLMARPAGEPPLESLRFVIVQAIESFMETDYEELEQRTRLLVEVPALRARMLDSMTETTRLLAEPLAIRVGRAADDLEIRVFTAAFLSALLQTSLWWGERDCQDDLVELLNRTVDLFGSGFRL